MNAENHTERRFLVRLHTTPSPGLAFYTGAVQAFAKDEEEAGQKAVARLCRTTFQGHSAHCFVVDSVERLARRTKQVGRAGERRTK